MLEMVTHVKCSGPIPETLGVIGCATYAVSLCYVIADRRRNPEWFFAGKRWTTIVTDVAILAVWLLVALVGIAVLAGTYNVSNYYTVETLLAAALIPAYAVVAAISQPLRFGYLHAITGLVWGLAFSLVALGFVDVWFWMNLPWPLMIGGFVGSRLRDAPETPFDGGNP
jgi:hypothetical protein